MKTKKTTITTALFALAMLTAGLPASAEGWGWGNRDASAAADFGGFGATNIDAHWSETGAAGEGGASTYVQTDHPLAEADAYLYQLTGGVASDRHELYGEMEMGGFTNTEAEVGRNDREASTETYGEGFMYGNAEGHDTEVTGGMGLASEQSSHVIARRHGGSRDGQAVMGGFVGVAGVSSGNDHASVVVGGGLSVQVSTSN